jgi:hypothetical protein
MSFQTKIHDWMLACFNVEIAADKTERNYRFLEESLELVQSCGCSKDDALALVDYVYGRPLGNPSEESGGVLVTLAALCTAHGIDMQSCGDDELERIWEIKDKIRAKQANKPQRSPLPA